MEGLDGDHMVTPDVTSRNNRGGAVFSVRGRCRRSITDTANRLLGKTRNGLTVRKIWS
jgi:hypothetical protein